MQFERTNIDGEITNKIKIARNNINGDNTENNEEEKRLETIRVNIERKKEEETKEKESISKPTEKSHRQRKMIQQCP